MRRAFLYLGVSILGCVTGIGQGLGQGLGQVSGRDASQTFEVATVKPAAPMAQPGGRGERIFMGMRGGPGTPDPGQITVSGMTLKNLIMTAYAVKPYQINGPDWLDSERYDIVAKVPTGATKEQVNVMWQNLLAERFGLVVHHESKEFQVDELVVAKGGHKLKESAEDAGPAPSPQAFPPAPPKIDKNGFPELAGPGMMMMMTAGPNGPIGHMVAKGQPLSQLATMLGNQLNRPVVDKTDLQGKYDFSIEFTPDLKGLPGPPPGLGLGGPAGPPAADASVPGSDLATAVQQQLGLRLVKSKAQLDVVVVDKAEKVPTEN